MGVTPAESNCTRSRPCNREASLRLELESQPVHAEREQVSDEAEVLQAGGHIARVSVGVVEDVTDVDIGDVDFRC